MANKLSDKNYEGQLIYRIDEDGNIVDEAWAIVTKVSKNRKVVWLEILATGEDTVRDRIAIKNSYFNEEEYNRLRGGN